jgi:hypothetical protein
MINLALESSILDSTIDDVQLITSNNHATYHFVNCSISIEINVNNETYQAKLVTGASFHQNDYRLPCNDLSVCNLESSRLLFLLDNEFDVDSDDLVEYINDECNTNYSREQLIEIYNELNDIRIEAQRIVDDAESEADEKLKNDEKVYVLAVDYEQDPHIGKIQCSDKYVLTFANKDEAQSYIDNLGELTTAEIVDKEIGISHLRG